MGIGDWREYRGKGVELWSGFEEEKEGKLKTEEGKTKELNKQITFNRCGKESKGG